MPRLDRGILFATRRQEHTDQARPPTTVIPAKAGIQLSRPRAPASIMIPALHNLQHAVNGAIDQPVLLRESSSPAIHTLNSRHSGESRNPALLARTACLSRAAMTEQLRKELKS